MRHLALIRGINVLGHKKVAMKDLKQLFINLGFKNIVTYIQSGNVLFDVNDMDKMMIKNHVEQGINSFFGFNVYVSIHSIDELLNILQGFPFGNIDVDIDGSRYHVTILERDPDKADLEILMSYVKTPERLSILGRTIYLDCPNGYWRTKLNNSVIESKLTMKATTRNWRTIVRLSEL